MACDPVQFLTNFGETDILSKQDASLAEKYLVHVWAGARSNTTCETFDQLRLESFISATVGFEALPPTSSEITGHIQRGAFLVHRACHLLEAVDTRLSESEPLEHGWTEHFGTLLPSKCLNPLPLAMLTLCKCVGKCDTGRCGCRSAGVSCTVLCHRKAYNPSCANLTRKD